MEHPIGALPRTPFPASRDFPSRGNEKIGGTGYCVTYDTESQSRNADFILIAPLKGKRLTTFCASLALLHPLLSLTHWIFRSLMLPYKSSSHSAKCVRCAPQGDTTTLGAKGPVKPKNPWAEGPSILRTFLLPEKGLPISLFHRASPGCRPCLSRHYSPVRPVSWLLFCCGRRSGSRR